MGDYLGRDHAVVIAGLPNVQHKLGCAPGVLGEHEPGIYNDTAEFVYCLDDCRRRENIPPITSALTVVEQLLSQGDAQTQEIATIGFIETLQKVASHSGAAEFYLPFLGPKTLNAWVTLNQYWARLMSSKAPRRKGSS